MAIPDQITDLAFRLLDEPLNPIPRYRIMRDLLGWPIDHPDMLAIYYKILQSRPVGDLLRSQAADGSWGRFYTRNKQVKFAGISTETALIRALALGLDIRQPAMQKLRDYLAAVLASQVSWPDKPDRTLDWPAGIRLVTAARLEQLEPGHPAAREVAGAWGQVLQDALQGGDFDQLAFDESFEGAFGHPPQLGDAMAFSLYGLTLVQGILPYELEERLVRDVIQRPRGIYLVNSRSLTYLPLDFPSRESIRFLHALEVLASFPSASPFLERSTEWLQDQTNEHGFWDFGLWGRDGLHLPLSENWRNSRNRMIDCTVWVLLLLARLQKSCEIRQTLCHNR